MSHLTSAELLRFRDGRPVAIGDSRARSLRDMRKHVGSCLQCTQALLELHASREALTRRAARRREDANGTASALPLDASPADTATTLRAIVNERVVPPPAELSFGHLQPGAQSPNRWLIVGFAVLAAVFAASQMLETEPPPPPPPSPPPVMVELGG